MEIKKNSIYEIEITDMGNEGEGIGHLSFSDGEASRITVFVKDTVIGDVAEILIMKSKKQIAYGKLLRLISPSPSRVTPICPIASRCGGCSMQHVSYDAQLTYKWNKVCECLRRIGKIDAPEQLMEPICGMEHPYHYRNKAQFPIGRNKDGEIMIGFYAGHTHAIIDCDHCAIGAEINDEIIRILRGFLMKYNISTYDETTGSGLVRHVLIRVGFATGEIMICLVVNGTTLPHADALIEQMTAISGMTSICLNVNTEQTNRILGATCKTLWGRPYIVDKIGDISYRISPLSFYQVNPVQTRKLYEKALSYAGLTGTETVWDMYCGIGTISLFLAQKAKQVYGVEIVPQAIDDARKNAELNHITNASFYVGKAEEVVPALYKTGGAGASADVVVVDPPRKGCDRMLLDTIARMSPNRIVYVSCDPATLARDVHILTGHGYTLSRVATYDQFCHSGHVEAVACLSRSNSDAERQ